MPQPRSHLFSPIDLLLLLNVVIWGANFAVVKQTLNEMLPLAFNALRFSLASLFLLLTLMFSEGGFLLSKKDFKGIFVLGLIGHTCYQFLFINGIDRTTASLSALTMATCPVFVALLSLLTKDEKPSASLLLGAFLSLMGVFVLVYGSQASFVSVEKHVLGSVLVLIASVCWAVYTVLSKPYLARYSPLRLTATTTVLGTIVLDVLAIPSFLTQKWTGISLVGWMGLAYSFGLAIVLGYIIWGTAVHRIGPGKTAVYQNLNPVVAAIVAYLFLGEILGTLQIVGAGMVFMGVYLTRRA